MTRARAPGVMRLPMTAVSPSSRLVLACLVALAACGGDEPAPTPGGGPGAAPGGPAAAPGAAAPAKGAVREPLAGGPFPALLVTQAQFVERAGPDGKPQSVPGPARLVIVRQTPGGWTSAVLEDPDSNVFHKAAVWDGGVLTIGGNQALLRTWRFADGRWTVATHWTPKFGGRFDRLRDFEVGDVDGDGAPELVIATHDQGVIAIVHPDESWRVEEIDRTPSTFVQEIEIGDVDGDGKPEFFATPSAPNKLDQEQPGEVRMYRRGADGAWTKSIVDAPGDTHAKEVLTADVDRDGRSEVYVAWEGAIGPGGALVRPVTVKQYRWKEGKFVGSDVAQIPDRQMRALAAGDVNGDGKIDLVGGALASGLWLFEQGADGWTKTLIDQKSSGYEHPVLVADLDGDGRLELYAGAEDQQQLRRYVWRSGQWEQTLVAPLRKGDITWNVTAGKL